MTTNVIMAQNKYDKDVSSIDAVIEALYGSISGDPGEKRDWDRFNFLFVENAKLQPTSPSADGGYTLTTFSPQEYIERSGSMLEERGFFETEIHRQTESFGAITHVWSTYDSRWGSAEAEPFGRGINSIQLLNDGDRWWIVSIFWMNESDDYPLPDRYLPD